MPVSPVCLMQLARDCWNVIINLLQYAVYNNELLTYCSMQYTIMNY